MHFPSSGELALRLLLAAALGGLVGLERELAGHRAGLRTHISVALGAALFGVVSAYGFQAFDVGRERTIYQVDVTRIASQIVVGVGFLGGGTILKEGANVRGLTTAASLWVTAAIGTAIALGSVTVGLVASAILLGSLVLLRFPRRWIRGHLAQRRDTVILRLGKEADSGQIISALYGLDGVEIREVSVRRTDEGVEVRADLVGERGVDIDTVLAPLVGREDVVGLETA